MDRVVELLKQYRYGILVLLLGLGLMLLPSGKEEIREKAGEEQIREADIQEQLSEILCQIDGAGKVRVLLTEAVGQQILYQQDCSQSENTCRQDTVVITDENRMETGLISQVIPAKYLGAIIVCQGGDRPSVKLAIVEAVSGVTGLTSDKITVLKMK